MELTGERRINAPRQRVWDALNDPEVLKGSIPGCQEIEKTSDTDFTAVVMVKVGPVKAKFKGDVALSDIDPPNGYKISGSGKGGAAGFGKGEATVTLKEDGDATILVYTVHASVGGKLAQIGNRLIESTARKLSDEFFDSFCRLVEEAEEGGQAEEAEAVTPPPQATEKEPSKGLNPAVWITALILLGLLVLYFARS